MGVMTFLPVLPGSMCLCPLFSRKEPTKQQQPTSPSNPQPESRDIAKLIGKQVISSKGEPSPYIIEKHLGGGGFGQIFLGSTETNSRQKVAIKLERMDAPQKQLYLEFGFYVRLGKDCIYAPAIYFFGSAANWNALVMQLLGPSLRKMVANMGGKFSATCTAALGISLLEIFRDFHGNGILFRDVKPENFLVGLPDTESAHLIFMIDLGLCKDWRQENGEHIPFATGKCLTGTPLYMSVAMHQCHELSRRDDLESILYMLVLLQTGTLPWLAVDEEYPNPNDWMLRLVKYGEIKAAISANELCAKMAPQFKHVFTQIRKLAFKEEPDYPGYINQMVKILTERNIAVPSDFQQAYDWNQAHKRRPNRARRLSDSRRRSSSGKSKNGKSKVSKARSNRAKPSAKSKTSKTRSTLKKSNRSKRNSRRLKQG